MKIRTIIYCGFVGALSAGILAFCAFVLVDIFMANDADEGKAWTEFTVMMMGLSGVVIGFILGAVYGAIQSYRRQKR